MKRIIVRMVSVFFVWFCESWLWGALCLVAIFFRPGLMLDNEPTMK